MPLLDPYPIPAAVPLTAQGRHHVAPRLRSHLHRAARTAAVTASKISVPRGYLHSGDGRVARAGAAGLDVAGEPAHERVVLVGTHGQVVPAVAVPQVRRVHRPRA